MRRLSDLVEQPIDLGCGVVGGDADEDEQSPPDRPDQPIIHAHAGGGHALHDGTHDELGSVVLVVVVIIVVDIVIIIIVVVVVIEIVVVVLVVLKILFFVFFLAQFEPIVHLCLRLMSPVSSAGRPSCPRQHAPPSHGFPQSQTRNRGMVNVR